MRKTAILRNISVGTLVGIFMLTLLWSIFNTVDASSGSDDELVSVKLLSALNLASNKSQLDVIGTVVSLQDLSFSFERDGKVRRVYVEPGDFVEAGDLIATNYYSTIRASFDGEIVSIFSQAGEYLSAGDSVGILLNRDDVEVETYLSVEDANGISVGNTAIVNGESIGEIVGISSKVDAYSQTLKVRIKLDELEDLIIGEQVDVEIERDMDDVTLVPLTAVAYDGIFSSFVFYYYDGAVYQKKVNTGKVFDSYIEVYSLDDTSIVEDIGGLSNGQAVSLTL